MRPVARGPPAALVRLDPVLFEQVLFNLLDNAGKYTPQGSEVVVRGRRAGGAGPPASSSMVNTVAVADRAVMVCWSLRFMVNVLLWVTGVVCNYNT